MTHDHFGRTSQHTNGTLTHRVSSSTGTPHPEDRVLSSTGTPHPEGDLKNTVRKKIPHSRQIYEDKPDPIIFMTVATNTSGHVYYDFVRLFLLHTHRDSD